MNATSGPTSVRQFATYDPDTQSWKMWPATGLWGSIEYSETWPRTGSMSGGQAFEHPTLEHLTTANGSSSFLPTPTASLGEHRNDNGQDPQKRKDGGHQASLADVACYLPTPSAADGNGGGRYNSTGHQSTLPGTVRLLAESTGVHTPPLFDVGSD